MKRQVLRVGVLPVGLLMLAMTICSGAESEPGPERTEYALGFDGKSSHVVVPSLKYDGTHPITFEAWLVASKAKTGYVISNNQGAGIRLSLQGFAEYQYAQWVLSLHDAKEYHFATSNKGASLGREVHVAGTFDGREFGLFVDGKRQLADPPFDSRHKPSTLSFLIGANPDRAGRPTYAFAGLIDEVRVSKVVRYTEDFTPTRRFETDESTVALYHFDEGNGEIAHDSSGNDHHGQIKGATWVLPRGKVIIRETTPGRLAALVDLTGSPVIDAGLEHLKGLNSLRALHFLGPQFEFAILGGQNRRPSFYELYLARTQATEGGLERLTTVSNLQELYIIGAQVSDAGLECLQGLSGLQELGLHNIQVSDVGLDHLKRLCNLQKLHVRRTRVTDVGLERLKGLSNLRELDLGYSGFTDAGLEQLKGLTSLQILSLYRTRATDGGLEHLKGLTNLEELHLGYTQVTDAGV